MEKVKVKLADIKPDNMRAQFEPVEIPDEIELKDLIALSRRTMGRVSFVLHASGNMATVSWVDYIYDNGDIQLWTVHDPDAGKQLGSAQIGERQLRDVIILHPVK